MGKRKLVRKIFILFREYYNKIKIKIDNLELDDTTPTNDFYQNNPIKTQESNGTYILHNNNSDLNKNDQFDGNFL